MAITHCPLALAFAEIIQARQFLRLVSVHARGITSAGRRAVLHAEPGIDGLL